MRLPLLPFRLRIALFSVAVSGVVLVGFGMAAWFWLNHERIDALDREIRALAYRHPGWMNNRANYERLGSAIEFIFGEDRKDRLVLLAASAEGEVRFRSEHWPREIDPASLDLELSDASPSATGPSPEAVSTESPGDLGVRRGGGAGRVGAGRRFGPGPGAGGGWGGGGMASGLFTKTPRFFSVKTEAGVWRLGILGNDEDRLVVGLDGGEIQAELSRMRSAFLFALPLALALIGTGGWWVAGQAVRPLRRIARTAEQTTARGLDQRIPATGDDPEIDRLIAVLNRMMDRLQASFRQATRFGADASHELKTPLAVMHAELEQALQSAEDGSRDQRVYASLLEETRRLKTITRGLLLLAQADSGHLPLAPETLALGDELEDIAADARILAEAADLELRTNLPHGVVVSADRVLLRLSISNLVDNAIHYNRSGGWVRLELESGDDEAVVRVSNTGPGIPSEEQAGVFDRFRRGRDAASRRRDGMGLGLSLAREIALAHGGRLTLERSDPAVTEFRLTLPTSRRAPEAKAGERSLG